MAQHVLRKSLRYLRRKMGSGTGGPAISPVRFYSAVEKRLKNGGVVVAGITGSKEECDGALAGSRQERFPGFGIGAQFAIVAPFEFTPLFQVMGKPMAEGVARGNLFKPAIEVGEIFLEAARPEPIDEEALTVFGRGRIVNAFDPDKHSEIYNALPELAGGCGSNWV